MNLYIYSPRCAGKKDRKMFKGLKVSHEIWSTQTWTAMIDRVNTKLKGLFDKKKKREIEDVARLKTPHFDVDEGSLGDERRHFIRQPANLIAWEPLPH